MDYKITVLYQDEFVIVACKPYGVLSEDDGKKVNMSSLLQEQTGCVSIYPVHRLDRTTQGVMVYAKTKEAASALSAQIQRGEMKKTYLAAAEGVPDEPSGEYVDWLYFDRRKNKSYVVKRGRKGVKEARLQYEVLKSAEQDGKPISLLRIRLLTGRTHQIRVQLASRKMPLIGDRRYGSHIASEHIMLCSSELSFLHPATRERMEFSYTPTNECFGYCRRGS